MSESSKTSILAHLRELRKRLLWSLIAVAVITAIAFWQADLIFEILKKPAGDTQFVFIEVIEGFSTYMKVCFITGVIVAMPVIMYNFLMFVIPALTTNEKRMVLIILPWILVMFYGGVVFGYFYLVPPATNFLLGFGSEVATIQPRMSNYVNFIMQLLLIIGLMFEMPVVTTFLSRIGVISYKWLSSKRKMWIILSFIVSAVITPTPDAVNQCIVAGTLIVLYEISIWLAWLIDKTKKKEQEI